MFKLKVRGRCLVAAMLFSNTLLAGSPGLLIIDSRGLGALGGLPAFVGIGESSTEPLPLVNDLLGSEITNFVLSNGVPGLDLLLDNPSVGEFTPVAGELLQIITIADLLSGVVAVAP